MKPIHGFDGLYSVTEDGRVFSHRRGIFLKNRKSKTGYCFVGLLGKNLFVHRLVGLAYISNSKNLPEINHKNLNKEDNRVENLEWCTHQQNMQHKHNTKVPDEGEIQLIRCLRKTGDFGHKDIAVYLGMSTSNVFNICTRLNL